jgi:hypothetical protein
MIDFFVLVLVHMHHWCISMCGALEPSSYPPATSLPVDVIDHGAAYLPFAGGRWFTKVNTGWLHAVWELL